MARTPFATASITVPHNRGWITGGGSDHDQHRATDGCG
jgi:hypothetical protein